MVKVLVVEDNELNMKLFQDLLSLMDCEIIATRTGTNAFELCKTYIPDLILMDIQLDGISGIDIIKQVKSDSELSDIPVIAISAYAMKHEEAKILQSGCDKYISKPMSIEHFFSTVKHYIEKANV